MTGHQAQTEDLRELPAYSISEAAHYLTLPAATVRYWSVGLGDHNSLITASQSSPTLLLSFLNLSELHVLAAIRREHVVTMPKIRKAIQYLVEKVPVEGANGKHPLLNHNLETNGLDLFIERYGQLINISQSVQTAMRGIISAALKRIARDPDGIPIKLYPFTRNSIENAPSVVVIDPTISAGRPVINGTGLTTQIIAERYKAGDSVKTLVADYERTDAEIEEALRCELPLAT